MSASLTIRRIVIDVDKPLKMPSLMEIAASIHRCRGVQASNVTVTEVDQETVGTNITIEGDGMDYEEIVRIRPSSDIVICHRYNTISRVSYALQSFDLLRSDLACQLLQHW